MTAARPEWSGWTADILPGFQQATLPLGEDPDGEGPLVATLVRRADPARAQRALLSVHGFTDYFFHTELADHLAERGIRLYALDLPKCGRSHRDGQTPHFTTDLSRYDRELDAAAALIAAEHPATVVYGHSTGGLVVTLWLDRRRRRGAGSGVDALVLNSPFFDLRGPALVRTRAASTAIGAVSRVRGTRVLRQPGSGGYGLTLHRDYHGEFDYDLRWKPLAGFPITFGWITAVRRAQARLHRGLDVGVPNLILRSDHTVPETASPEVMQRGDAVLDVAHIARWAGCVGARSTIVPVTDAKHDVFLSLPGPRARAYAELDGWLDQLPG